jgi:hypothetical protein
VEGHRKCNAAIAGNRPPDAPTIDGPKSGEPGVILTYTFVASDEENENVKYFIDWDDGTNTGWIGPYNPGVTVNITHVWSEEGSYKIKQRQRI